MLSISPLLQILTRTQQPSGEVFPTVTYDFAVSAMRPLRGNYGTPVHATFKILRATCGTYLTNAPGIFGAASAYRSAKQLGHSVTVAETHYVHVGWAISDEAKSLGVAMGIGVR